MAKMKENFSNDYRKINESSYLMEVYNSIQNDIGEEVPYHWHFEPEVTFCHLGEVDINCNGQLYHMEKSDIIFINSSQIHNVHIYPHSETLTFAFDLDSLISKHMDQCDKKYLAPLKNLDTVIVTSVISNKEYHEAHKKLQDAVKKIIDIETVRPFGYQLELKSALFHFIYLMVNISVISPYKDNQYRAMIKNYDYLKDVLKYFDMNYKEKIKIEELASIAHMSSTYFCKYFKKIIGKSPMEYLNLIRIQNAEKLLVLTDKRILDIAYDVGFQNLSYFSSVFKQYKNISPSEYRQNVESKQSGIKGQNN